MAKEEKTVVLLRLFDGVGKAASKNESNARSTESFARHLLRSRLTRFSVRRYVTNKQRILAKMAVKRRREVLLKIKLSKTTMLQVYI